MTPDHIMKWAREAGLAEVTDTAESLPADYVEALAKLCALAVSKEREECAKWYAERGWLLDEEDVPAAIRARGEADPLTRYRVWSDGTVQEGAESPYTWMSDDFEYVDATDAEQAALSAAMRKDNP